MVKATFNFPRGFLWGTATASHQVEGNNTNNNWHAWEQEAGRIANGDTAGLATDWWGGRWREDFDRAAETGQNAHRLSIEWSRVQPATDHWDEDAIDRYRRMLRDLSERGLTRMVTLHHFSDPLWLYEQGGWEHEDAPEFFAAYVHKMVEALKGHCNLWVTINEPNVYATAGYVLGLFPPGKKDRRAAFRVMANLVRGHAAAYHAIHEIQPEARVGMANYYRGFAPERAWFPPDRAAAGVLSRLLNDFFPRAAQDGRLDFVFSRQRMPEAAGTQDFLGLNYYTSDVVRFAPLNPGEFFARRRFAEGAAVSPNGEIANRPEGFFKALKWAKSFGLPIIVTENGIEDAGDELRPRFIAEHVRQLWRAVNFNYPVKGYFHWTLVDNFEWHRGWAQRFGLWELDVETQARRRRRSADLYAAICKENALSTEMIAEYAPEIFAEMFP
jgi:beta-glucosidase